MHFDADLHLHGRFSRGVSRSMTFLDVLRGAKKKGLTLIGSGDVLHPLWREEVKKLLVEENGAYLWEEGGIYVIPQVEVEDRNRVHHVVILESFEEAEELARRLEELGVNLRRDGRPKVPLGGRELFDLLEGISAFLGPAHAFTPYFGIYAHTDSVLEYYDTPPHFLELGLSADTGMVSSISELRGVPFLSNSDAHSTSPRRLGREFQRMRGRPSFRSLKRFDILFNAGLDPREGKYHITACNRCYKKYTLEEAERLKWRCPCGGRIKKGVKDRVAELSDGGKDLNRPPYLHVLPLAEIIEYFRGSGKTSEELYEAFISTFGNEIAVLLDAPPGELAGVDEEVAAAIEMMRKGEVLYYPGGGGKYGDVFIPLSEEEYEEKKAEIEERLRKELSVRQRSLFEFVG